METKPEKICPVASNDEFAVPCVDKRCAWYGQEGCGLLERSARMVAKRVALEQVPAREREPLELTIANTLDELGVPNNGMGYSYLAYALDVVTRDPGRLAQAMVLYTDVGKHFSTSGHCAERRMRASVEAGLGRIPLDVLDKWFGNSLLESRGKPALKQFLATVSNKLRLARGMGEEGAA